MRFIILAIPICLVAVIAGGVFSPPAPKQAPAAIPAKAEATAPNKDSQDFIKTGIGPLGELDERGDADFPEQDLPVRVRLPNKGAVEWPVENAVFNQSATLPANFNNPQVMPGKVCWHASFEDACKASQKSHKPVLLFHMLGNLDQQFC